MTTTREPSFEQVMAHIDQVLEGETGDAEAARALALTDAEVLAELAEAGVDADAVRTMALEVLARHAPAAPAPSSLTEPLTAHGPDAPDASAPRLPDAHDGAPAPAEAVPQSSADRHVDRDEPPSVTNLRRLFPVAAVVLAIAAAIVLVVVLLPDQGIAPPHIALLGEPAQHVFIERELALHFPHGRRRRFHAQQDIMALAIFLDTVSQRPQTPIFALLDSAAIGFKLGNHSIGDGIGLRLRDLAPRDDHGFV